MAWRHFPHRAEAMATPSHSPPSPRTKLAVEALEERVTPAAMSSYEASALAIVNTFRSNPVAFANDLNLLYRGNNYASTTGYTANDPVWTDLRAEINNAEATSSWRSGFTSSGANTFMSVASALPARAPLAWDSAMQDGAAGHNAWMYSNVYAHSVFTQGAAPSISESPSYPIPGITRNFNVATGDYFNYIGLGLNAAAENISYGYNIGGAMFQAYQNGQISLDGYYQRLVYADVIGFMLEYNNGSISSPWGHLQNLAGNYNVTGIANLFYENPVEGPADGVSESYFATERFGLRTGSSYANVYAYYDTNGNNVYDAGEGLPAEMSFNFGATSVTLPATGYSTLQLPTSGTYTVSGAYLGNALGSQQVVANGANKTLVFRVTSLVDAAAPVSQVAHLPVYETSANFLVQWSGTDAGGSGIASYNVYASVDGGSFTLWQSATSLTQATYAGALGHRYAFYSTAIDRAGNQQTLPNAAQASTEVRAFDVAPPSNLASIASLLSHSAENYANFVRQAYLTYLGRPADSGGLTQWVNLMSRGQVSDEQLEANFVGSAEYIASHGGNGAGWVTGLYQDLLGRTPLSGEVASWVAALAAGASPVNIAFGFAASAERQGIRVGQNYLTYLGRTGTAPEIAYWVDQFVNHGMSTETMAAQFVGSREFFNNSSKGASTFSVWVTQAYQAILRRAPSATDAATFVSALNPPANSTGYAGMVTRSSESYGYFITQAYQTYLGRSPDPAGFNNWLSSMLSGQTSDERLEAQLIGSTEYITSHGGAGAGWVNSMYSDLLKRTPSASEVSNWVAALNGGVSAASIAYAFAASAERQALRVRQNYATFLGRAPSQAEVNAWVDQFVNRGMTNEIMSASFMGTPEYFRNPAKGNGNIIAWLDAVFTDVYHRPITLNELLAIAPTIQ